MTDELLPSESVSRFRQDGAVVLKGVIDASWRQLLVEAVEEALRHPTPLAHNFVKAGQGRFHSDMYLSVSFPAFRRFAQESGVGRLASELLGARRIVLFTDEILIKESNTPKPTPWHHDLSYWPLAGSQVISLWLPLDPITAESGAMEFVRGSHRWDQRFHPINFDSGAPRVTAHTDGPPGDYSELPAEQRLSAPMEPGDLLAFHAKTLHRANGNTQKTSRRRVVILRLCGDDVRFDPRPQTIPVIWAPRCIPGQPLDDPELFFTLYAAR